MVDHPPTVITFIQYTNKILRQTHGGSRGKRRSNHYTITFKLENFYSRALAASYTVGFSHNTNLDRNEGVIISSGLEGLQYFSSLVLCLSMYASLRASLILSSCDVKSWADAYPYLIVFFFLLSTYNTAFIFFFCLSPSSLVRTNLYSDIFYSQHKKIYILLIQSNESVITSWIPFLLQQRLLILPHWITTKWPPWLLVTLHLYILLLFHNNRRLL